MNDIDIFKKINDNQIQGIMLHRNMMIYYDFLGIRFMKRCHEFHYLSETTSNDTINRYVNNHLNRIMIIKNVSSPFDIPENWENVDRMKVTNDSRKQYFKQAIDKWHDWEIETKKLYQECYKELCNISEIASAKKVIQLISCVDDELKFLERKIILFTELEWDLKSIMMFDNELHDKYAKKTKEIGFNIC